MLEIHPKAAENLNQKAAQILAFVRDIEPSDVQFPSFDPEIHPAIQVDGSSAFSSIYRASGINDDTVRLYLNPELSIGILEDGCLEIRKIVENLFKIEAINRKVSIKTLDTVLCTWIREKFNDPGFFNYLDFLNNHLENLIDEYEIIIPIEFLHIEKSFTLGNVIFRPFSKGLIDGLESRTMAQAQDSQQRDLAKMFFDQKIRGFQGHAITAISLQAEPERAYEIAIEETNVALAMLRIFSPDTQEPLSYYPCAIWGSANISRGYLMALKQGNFNQMHITTLDRRPMPGYLDSQTIDDLYSTGLEILDSLLQTSKRNLFQDKLLDALILYSRSAVSKDIADKLVYILVSLESIFLKNSSEPIQQNLGERIAFLIGDSLESRKRIIKVVRDAYNLRSRFIHHGGSINDLETMREFMRYAWRAVVSLIRLSNSILTIDSLLDRLDDRKLS